MPRYVYDCDICDTQREVDLRIEDLDTTILCDNCEEPMVRIVQPVNFKVKGACAANGYSDLLGDNPNYSPDRGFDQDLLEE